MARVFGWFNRKNLITVPNGGGVIVWAAVFHWPSSAYHKAQDAGAHFLGL